MRVFLQLRLKSFFFFCAFALYFVIPANLVWAKPPYEVIAYFATTYIGNSRGAQLMPANVPWNDITRIYEAFGDISGTTASFSPLAAYSGLIATAHANSCRVYLTMGGAGTASQFVSATSTAGNTTAFVTSIMSIVNSYGFDGIDIDWEFPNMGNSAPAEKAQFTLLIQDLYTALHSQTAYDGNPKGVDFYGSPGYDICGFDWPNLGTYVDYCVISGYAYQESIGGSTYDAPLNVPAGNNLTNCAGTTHPFSNVGEITELTTAPYNFPISKMILGCPLYTGDGNTDTYTATNSWAFQSYSATEAEALYRNGGVNYSVDTAQAYCDKINWAVGTAGMPGIALWEMSQACPYTSANVSGIWSAISGTSGCLTIPTATVTNTVTQTATNTPTHTATNTATNTATHTTTNTATSTSTDTPNGPTNTFTLTGTNTPTASSTNTASQTATNTPTNTCTETCTNTATRTMTNTPVDTNTTTNTQTQTFTNTITNTPTNTPTITSTFTNTPISSSTPTVTNTPSSGNPVVYPNPAPGSTVSIQVPLRRPSNVMVKVFTLAFREVAVQEQFSVPVGVDVVVPLVDKSGMALANGLYYFEIEANDSSWIKKVLVIR